MCIKQPGRAWECVFLCVCVWGGCIRDSLGRFGNATLDLADCSHGEEESDQSQAGVERQPLSAKGEGRYWVLDIHTHAQVHSSAFSPLSLPVS